MKAQPSKIKITEIKTTFNVKKKKKRGLFVLENIYTKMQNSTEFVILCNCSPVGCHNMIMAGASPVFQVRRSRRRSSREC